ncbi:Putative tyrosinase copper-binding domain, di-copper centre-containing domain superfamily [Colletotrichum destructivum]|uniref:Tyrosinase copper-binding domain, di-copper centre-containing domain superfamily n=1 Tax=Colletotrichum destructivum TaxID=34406 RepID=A0AAX4IRE6_9PEZI|nr:Putative tyrosinase copper-binding domain, di-copper centre-containing domain superfamily [Colletotrichum destructivum]
MRLANVFVVLGICAGTAFSSEGDELSEVQVQAIEALQAAEKNGTFGKRGECNLFNARVRRDWNSLSGSEKKAYTSAVNCLLTRPSKLRGDFAPGARNRYDDFVAAHINQTLSIHATGNFLTWHRYYVWAYENALREECGYDGYQPYWNWLAYRDDPSKAPMFDGSDTSMSGDGTFRAHNGSVAARGGVWIPSGNGGACVTSGPFANMTVHLGPVRPGIDGLPVNPGGSFAYNPRCLSRDISAWTSQKWMNPSDVLNLTIGAAAKNVLSFQDELQGRFGDGFLGTHTAGHMIVNGEASDLFSSSNDPTFFLHHAMVDRVYWLWQALHLGEAFNIAGTITISNNPPSRDARLDDIVIQEPNAPNRPISDLLNTIGGSPFCYIYL